MKLIMSIAMALLVAACAEPLADDINTTLSSAASLPVVTSSSIGELQTSPLPMCLEIGPPTAPEDWYADTPIYVGNEMPSDEVRVFAEGLGGYQSYWIDRDHHGWIGVGFVKDADVAAYQSVLEAEFPGVGVVAVAMPWTAQELEEIRLRIQGDLPEDMQTAGVYEVQGYVEVWVGLLTPERIAMAEEIIGGDPACLSGRDPATTPLPGPQPAGGDGWTYLGETDTGWAGERPLIVAAAEAFDALWKQLGMTAPPPAVDFGGQIALSFLTWHSGSCPLTRLDAMEVQGDLVQATVVDLPDDIACTDDAVPRTYLVSMDRDHLPPPPFRFAASDGFSSQLLVEADLRVPGSVPADNEVSETTPPAPLRTPTTTPHLVEGPGVPFVFTLEMACGIDYLGAINWVPWHLAVEPTPVPVKWEEATVDGLLDLDMMMTEGPKPTLTATAGGVDLLYLPGPDDGEPCT